MQKPFYSFLLFFAALLIVGCGKSTDTPESADVWTVTKFIDLAPPTGQVDQNEDTHRFNGYSFEFDNGNLLTVRYPDGTTREAKWALLNNDTVLAFSMENPPVLLEELVGSWTVETYTATQIKLVNPAPGGTADFSKQAVRIEFQKN